MYSLLFPLLLLAGVPNQDAAVCAEAEAILAATGVQGGLVVHLGCGEGRLTAALRRHESYVVHGLEPSPARVAEARRYIRSLGLYGAVSVECRDDPVLPYVDHAVNLLVAEFPGQVSPDEMMRVLVPGGVAYVKQPGDAWTKTVKPPRQGVDEWTHFLYDASGNPVARDQVVGPPRHLQWTAEPRHSRSHEYTPSIQAVVSSGGRIFYVADQGSLATLRQPADWKVVARDAYNGVLLWEKPIEHWFPHLCGWTQGPAQLQHKLVAVGERVYVTLGLHAPLSELEAGTGETLREYAGTEGAEEIRWHRGILLLAVREVTEERLALYRQWKELETQSESPLHQRDPRVPLVSQFGRTEKRAPLTIQAIEAATGRVIWKMAGDEAEGLRPLSLRASGDRVYFEKPRGVVCLDLQTGRPLWTAPQSLGALRAVSETAVVCANKQELTVLSPVSGEPVWQKPLTLTNVRDVLLIGDAVWVGGGRPYDTGNPKHTGPAWGPYFAVEYKLSSGEVGKEIGGENPGHHHRCYDNKATGRYILGGRRGTEFLDLETGDYLWNSWARGTCRYGVMPSNGMVYVPPHACGCYVTVKLTGFNAMAPAREAGNVRLDFDAAGRLERGPAFAGASPQASVADVSSWPTYRGDPLRSGRADAPVPADVGVKWRFEAGGELTAPTVAGGKVYVARPEQQEVLALDAQTGKAAWAFTPGGRVDSPPTIHEGGVLFGCRDGFVYCLRASDGGLAWRFRAARDPRRILDNGQVESASPVHGSVLVQDGAVAFVAGRSSYLDGGLDLFRLNPATGEMLSRTPISSPDPETGRQPEQYGPSSMPGARSDILAGDGTYLYLRDLAFSKDGAQAADRPPHLFTLTDYLDDSWAHRSYWVFGSEPSLAGGCSGRVKNLLYGRLLVFDETTVVGYGRESVHWSSEFEDGEYRVFARRREADKPHWSQPVPVRLQALLLAGDKIFAAGAGPAPSQAPGRQTVSPVPLLLVLSATDGAELARHPIPAAPVFNGMAAAGGELLLTLENGQVLCLAGAAD